MTPKTEVFVSVDVETAGPYPGRYSMLSIGACLVSDPSVTFYLELQPLSQDSTPEAMEIGGFSLAVLEKTGMAPEHAMLRFAAWIEEVVPPPARPVFVAFNAPFDWSFVNDYFHRFLGYNPFGHSGVDIKAYYMGMTGVAWSETSIRHVTAVLGGSPELSHNALNDAVDQSTLFRVMLDLPKLHEVTQE
jgi:ribonuclease T